MYHIILSNQHATLTLEELELVHQTQSLKTSRAALVYDADILNDSTAQIIKRFLQAIREGMTSGHFKTVSPHDVALSILEEGDFSPAIIEELSLAILESLAILGLLKKVKKASYKPTVALENLCE